MLPSWLCYEILPCCMPQPPLGALSALPLQIAEVSCSYFMGRLTRDSHKECHRPNQHVSHFDQALHVMPRGVVMLMQIFLQIFDLILVADKVLREEVPSSKHHCMMSLCTTVKPTTHVVAGQLLPSLRCYTRLWCAGW